MEIHQITRLREERASAIAEMRGILDAGSSEKRDNTAEERAKYDKLEARVDEIDADVQRGEKFQKLQASTALNVDASRDSKPAGEQRGQSAEKPLETSEYRSAFAKMLVRGQADMTSDERRALSVGTNSAGGYTVPVGFYNQLIAALRLFGRVRNLSNVIETAEGNTLQVPFGNAFGAAAWGSENTTYGGTDVTFAQVALSAYKAVYLGQISEELLQDSAFDLESYLAKKIGENLAILENTAFVNGTGSGQPTGIVTSATVGITAANATSQVTAIVADSLFDLYHSVAPQYRVNPSCAWLMNDSTVKGVRKIKDTQGRYLWEPSLASDRPDTLLGKNVVIDPDMPVMAANAKSIVFGDFSRYAIRVAGGVSMRRLDERFADAGQVGFVAHERVDGKLVDPAGLRLFVNAAS